MLKKYYRDSLKARQDKSKLIAWASAGDPEELLWAMDIIPVYPENFVGACTAKQISPILCQAAEEAGFPPDLCSYFRTACGYAVGQEKLTLSYPGGGMPNPDLILCGLNGCLTETT